MDALNRRDFIGFAAKAAILSGMTAGWPVPVAAQDSNDTRTPNFIFILADDMGWGDLPCYGHRNVTAHGGWTVRGELSMPRIDRMAAEGTRFLQFYVNSPVCSPTRTGIMTGRYPSELAVHDYFAGTELNRARSMPDYVTPSQPMLTRMLKEHGYSVAHYGKWHLCGNSVDAPSPELYGIDEYAGCLDGPMKRVGSTGMIADKTIAFIQANSDRPFFINTWLYDPHSPLKPTSEQIAPYADLSPGWGDQAGALQVWYGVLTNMDLHIGRILDTIDELGIADHTYVIFASDNGPAECLSSGTSHHAGAPSTGPFRGLKRSLYEGGIREPFIVRCPGRVSAGRIDTETIITGTDFLPTLLALADIDLPEDVPFAGENMSDAIHGHTLERKKPVYWEYRFPAYGHLFNKSPVLAIREGRWKLLMNPDRSRMELYDIQNDPTELLNLASRFPTIVDRLSAKLLEWRRELPPGAIDPTAGSIEYPWPGMN